MRKRIPRYAGGQVHMSDVDRKILREFQTQGQVDQGDFVSESQLRGLEGAITGSYITPRDVTYTPQEEERFKKLMSGRVGRRFDKGQGARGMGILQRRFPNISDTDMMSLIDMYSSDYSMRKLGGDMMQPQMRKGGSKNWIKGAIKKPGALRATAKRAGALKKDGTIKKSWLQQQAKKGNTKTAQRARLALTLGKMKK